MSFIMNKLLLYLLLAVLPAHGFAFVTVKDGQFYDSGRPWRAVGVNLSGAACDKATFHAVAQFGWNSIRLAPTSTKQLRQLVKWAKRERLKLCVVVDAQWCPQDLADFANKQEIWAWEVASVAMAEQVKSACPNHLVTLGSDPLLTRVATYADAALFDKHIDFLAVTLLPIEQKWVAQSNLYLGLRNAYLKTDELLQALVQRMRLQVKPIVVAACSYPRDKGFRLPESATVMRDSYFQFVLQYPQHPNAGHALGGAYFQEWQPLPQEGADDAHLTTFSIYPNDTTTQQLVNKYSK
jgi:hypothetical protein